MTTSIRLLRTLVLGAFAVARDAVQVLFGPPRFLGRGARIGLHLRLVFARLVGAFRGESAFVFPLPGGPRWCFETRASASIQLREIYLDETYDCPLDGDRPLIVDVGANDGTSLAWFRLRHPGARLLAFEPTPAAHRLCRANLDRAGWHDVRLHEVALGSAAGEARMVCRAVAKRSGLCEMRRDGDEGEPVEVRTLSSHLDEEVALLKIDVEGSEWEILRDLDATGRHALVRNLIMEVHPGLRPHERLSEILALVEGWGMDYVLRCSPPRWGGEPPGPGRFRNVCMIRAWKGPSGLSDADSVGSG